MSSRVLSLALFTAVLSFGVVASADPPTSTSTTRAAPEGPHAIYRFDITVRRPDDAPNSHPPTYTINLEENHTGTVSVGANVPLVAAGSGQTMVPRQDIGFLLHLNFVMQGNTVVVTGNAEMSTVGNESSGPVSINRIRADGVVPLTVGRAGLFASIADMTTRRTYEIMITATRLL